MLVVAGRVESRGIIFQQVPPAFLPVGMVDEVLPWRWDGESETYKPENYQPRFQEHFSGIYMEVRVAPTIILQVDHHFIGAMVSISAMALSGNEMWSELVVSTLPLTYGALKRKILASLQHKRIASVGTEIKLFTLGCSIEKPPACNKRVFKVQKSRTSGSNKVQKDALKKPWPRHRYGIQQYNV